MDVLGTEPVFVAVLEEPLTRINHEDSAPDVSTLFVNNENTGRNPSAVEQIRG